MSERAKRERSDVANLSHESLCRLEGGYLVLGDFDSSILGDVAGSLFFTGLDDKAAKTTKIHVFAMSHGIFHCLHEFLNGCENCGLLQTGATRDLVYNIRFSHF